MSTWNDMPNDYEHAVAEIKRWRFLYGPESSGRFWLGECGHGWVKDQSENCPICERDRLRAQLSE